MLIHTAGGTLMPSLKRSGMTLERRVERLERQAKAWRRLACGLAGLVLVGIGVAAAPKAEVAEVLRARRIEVVDEAGNAVMVSASDKGGGFVYVFGKANPQGASSSSRLFPNSLSISNAEDTLSASIGYGLTAAAVNLRSGGNTVQMSAVEEKGK